MFTCNSANNSKYIPSRQSNTDFSVSRFICAIIRIPILLAIVTRSLCIKRMLYLNEIFHATTYQRVTRRDSTVICYTLNDKTSYGCIEMFIWYKHQGRNYVFAKVKEFLVVQRNETSHYVMFKDQSNENS